MDRTMLIDIIVKIAVTLVMVYVVPRINKALEELKKRAELESKDSQLNIALKLADVAVKSVQQDLWDKYSNQEKKAEAMKRVVTLMLDWGLKDFNADELSHYIETAVYTKNELEKPATLELEPDSTEN